MCAEVGKLNKGYPTLITADKKEQWKTPQGVSHSIQELTGHCINAIQEVLHIVITHGFIFVEVRPGTDDAFATVTKLTMTLEPGG
mgnify:CR=1 FL=1